MTTPVAILISGRGSNMEAIVQAAQVEGWDVRFFVLSNRPGAAGLQTAEDHGIETAVIDHKKYSGRREEFDAAIAAQLTEWAVDWIALAGFMRILGAQVTTPFANRILNIHPSLLPLYPGLHTHQRAIDAGDPHGGCTVHLVDESLDGGPILAASSVPILVGDTAELLAARVLVEEHRLYPAVLKAAINGEIDPHSPHSFSLRDGPLHTEAWEASTP